MHKTLKTSLFAVAALCLLPGLAQAREQIRAVGSSTVFPFVSSAAEEFGKATPFKTPIVEPTGTGGGFKLFCSGLGEDTPDISNASRAIKPSELETCKKNGVTDITEIKLGFDGIVLANSKQSPRYTLTRQQIFLGLAKQVPVKGALVANPYKKWNEIDAALPNEPIEVYGPPPTSGTRDAFVEMVMEKACETMPEFEVAYADKDQRQGACKMLREDGKFIETGENDNLIVQKLTSNPTALGIFGFSFLDQNGGTVQGSVVEGVAPEFETIADGSYGIARPLYVYVKLQHVDKVPGIREFVDELTSDSAMGEDGYLALKGLIPLPAEERAATREAATALQKLAF